jgi:2-methylisocitrate lyase-like PEP mutase family enzyme
VNVKRTVEEFEAAGVAAIHLEDQVTPKRCGHLPGSRPVVEMAEQVGKIEAAVAARRDPDFVIIARTDAAPAHGLNEAIRRGQAYRKAGADVVFVELKTSAGIKEELKRVTGEIDAPCLVNVEELGELGKLTVAELDALGLRIAIYPGLARYAAGYGIREALRALKGDGTTKAARDRMLTFREYNEALNLSEVEEWEKRFLLRS